MKMKMNRTNFAFCGAILCSDIHLREDQPICRTDNFEEAQWAKIDFIAELQQKYNCSVYHAGDLFHHWKPSPYLIKKTIEHLPKQFHTIYGQHDLPQHSFELKHKSGIAALEAAGVLTVLRGTHFGFIPKEYSINLFGKNILLWHRFVWDGKKLPWPGCVEYNALEVLKKYPNYDLILTGDHHKPFVTKYRGQILVNPGCLTRQAADYQHHAPRVYLYDAKHHTVEPIFLPNVSPDVISTEHVDLVKQTNQRVDEFIGMLSEEWGVTMSFRKNLERAFSKNKTRKTIRDIIYKSLENGKTN